MKQGAYFARVTGDRVFTVFADEDAVRDAQMRKIFSDRDKKVADQQKQAAERQHMADRLALKKARKFRSMAKECLWLTTTAAMVYCTYRFQFGYHFRRAGRNGGCRNRAPDPRPNEHRWR